MENKKGKTVLHICSYSAAYPGNFINSLRSLEEYEQVTNIYLFPARARDTDAKKWIEELNAQQQCAYIQPDSNWGTFWLIKRIIKKHNVDKVVLHFTSIVTDAIVKLAVPSKKVVIFFHHPYRPCRKSAHLLRSFLWHGSTFVGVSDFVADLLRKEFPKENIHSVVNAIDFSRLDHFEHMEKQGEIVATIMGWDRHRKGLDLALLAVEKLREKYNIVLQIVASINADAMQHFIVETLGKDVDWATTLPPRNDVATYLNATDIFLSPSRIEAFGYAVVEAAYCQNSIVASRVDGQGELKIDGVYWFESDNVEELCQQIENSILERNLPEKIQQRAKVKDAIQETYSLKQWSHRLAQLL